MLREQVGKERRPLSWNVGAQNIIKPEKISQREAKREERMKMGSIKGTNEI
jgi:NADH-quinone oxidoreductase subunit B